MNFSFIFLRKNDKITLVIFMLKIKDLTVKVDKKTILKDFNLDMKINEVHAIMGPN